MPNRYPPLPEVREPNVASTSTYTVRAVQKGEMMNPTPLNPDAVEAGAKAMYETRSLPGDWSWEELRGDQEFYRDIAQSAVSAYLAVAQPEVNSVEELEALPNGTLVKSGGREFYKTSRIEYPWVLPYGVDRFGSSYLAKHSKVTVIHRPEVKP